MAIRVYAEDNRKSGSPIDTTCISEIFKRASWSDHEFTYSGEYGGPISAGNSSNILLAANESNHFNLYKVDPAATYTYKTLE